MRFLKSFQPEADLSFKRKQQKKGLLTKNDHIMNDAKCTAFPLLFN